MVYQALEIATEAERAGQEEMAAKRVLDKAAVKVGSTCIIGAVVFLSVLVLEPVVCA
jgi:hypothetical protein